MTENGHIATEEVPSCLLCGTQGRPLYEGLRDRLFGAPGEWGFLQCPQCGLVWLNPRPVPADLAKAYRMYYTHSENGGSRLRQKARRALYSTVPGYGNLAPNWLWRQFGKGLTLSSLLRERAFLGTMCLDGNKKGKLLDVGCGSGEFLALMRDAGWDVAGVEPDPLAAKLAREQYGVFVSEGTPERVQFPEESFDAITLSHVIEHVYDPIALLGECRRLLKPGGKVVVVTPNIESLGHEVFRSCWRGLEPPRHLYLLSLRTLCACCQQAGFAIQLLRTSSRSAAWVCALSSTFESHGARSCNSKVKWGVWLKALGFQCREELSRRAYKSPGEELLLVGTLGESSRSFVASMSKSSYFSGSA